MYCIGIYLEAMQSTHLHQFFGILWQPKILKRRIWVTLPAHTSVAFSHLLRKNFNTFLVKQDFEESSLLGNYRGFQPTVTIWLGMTRLSQEVATSSAQQHSTRQQVCLINICGRKKRREYRRLPNTAPADRRHEHELMSLSGRYTVEKHGHQSVNVKTDLETKDSVFWQCQSSYSDWIVILDNSFARC